MYIASYALYVRTYLCYVCTYIASYAMYVYTYIVCNTPR